MFKKIKNILNLFSFLNPGLFKLNEKERNLINDLRKVAQSQFISNDMESSEAGQEWLLNLHKLSRKILNEDPRLFLNWEVIQATMFVSKTVYTSKELKFIKSRPDWKARWRDAIIESPMGYPRKYLGYPLSSGNLIHHAYQIATFENITQKKWIH